MNTGSETPTPKKATRSRFSPSVGDRFQVGAALFNIDLH